MMTISPKAGCKGLPFKLRCCAFAGLCAVLGMSAPGFAAGAPVAAAAPAVAQASVNYLQTVRWDAEYDVVVIGYGFAGGAAAIAAADAGARVLLLEKAPEGHEGGNSRYAAQQAIWIDDTKASDEEILEYFRAMRGKSTNPSDEVYKAYIKEAKAQVEYLKKLGAKDPATSYYAEYPEFPGAKAIGLTLVKKPGGDGRLYALIQENVRSRQAEGKIDVWFDAPGKKLLQDTTTGIVHGVLAEVEGAPRNIRAKNGVVLATGGFENNIEMFRNFAGQQVAYSKGARYNTGDGILMAMDVKANMVNLSTINGPDPNVLNPETGISFGYMLAGPKDSSWGGPAFSRHDVIMVGADGKRFWNETEKTKHGRVKFHGDYRMLQMPDPAFMIFDEDARLASRVYGSWSEGTVEEIRKGLVKKADTIEELAAILKIDPAGLKAQIDAYNAACAAGSDEQFGRDKKFLKALDKGPFYGVEVVPTYTNTQGGPQHDEIGAVLDRDGKRIPHLYSAGELGSIFSWKYNGTGNIGESLIFGRISGAQAALRKTDVSSESVLKGEGWKPAVSKAKAQAPKAEADERIGRGRGMGGDVVIGVKTDKAGKITAVRVIESRETPGIGTKALEVLPDEAVKNNGKVDAVSGATVTTEAFRAALEDALK